jgi:hypothetical protein
MNTTSIGRVRPADAFPRIESSTQERLTHRVNDKTLCEIILAALTVGMATFLSYIFYQALYNYGAL